jgi:molybdate transport system ATP-binding protein
MAGELICDLRKRLSASFTLDAELRLPLDEARVTILFGPSGSGKTTLLRLIAGLDRPDSGSTRFRDQFWHGATPPQARRTGFLFQDYALFPHLTVRDNVAFAATASAASKMLEAFSLADLADRLPREISGGQQQRVALARALAANPSLLLLDEPLSALDAATRARTRHELRRILHESGVPSIVVTHDRMEAIALGDWIAVISGGRIRQTGPVQDVFRRPANSTVAESVGVENILPAEILSRDSGLITLAIGSGVGLRPAQPHGGPGARPTIECLDSGETGSVFACIRAEDVALTREPAPSSARNRLAGTVRAVIPEGALARVELDCGFPLVSLVTAQSAAELKLTAGDAIQAVIKTTSVHLAS